MCNTPGKVGLSPIQKCTAAIRQLAYGTSGDAQDEYVRIGESTALESLTRFCQGVIYAFEDEYMRQPTNVDVARLAAVGSERGFPGMLGSLDCMHWKWKNCPKAYQGHYTGRDGHPTVILEVVASYDLWIWHAFFGLPGSLNDINVLDRSPLFNKLATGNAPPCQFNVNGHHYDMGYYLADGIYPSWATLVKTFTHPQDEKKKVRSSCFESLH